MCFDALNSFMMGRGHCNCCGIFVVCFMLNITVKLWELQFSHGKRAIEERFIIIITISSSSSSSSSSITIIAIIIVIIFLFFYNYCSLFVFCFLLSLL